MPHTYSWTAPYSVIDNFLSSEVYEWCCDFFNTGTFQTHPDQNHNWRISKNKIFATGESQCADDFMQEIHRGLESQMLQYLKQFAPHRLSLYEWAELNFVACGADVQFPIHNDTENKLLSVVVYLAPHHNQGTVLYQDEQGTNPHQVEWQPNRALIFARTPHTWHSYASDGATERQTLIYNLRGKQ